MNLRLRVSQLFDGQAFIDDAVMSITAGVISAIDHNIDLFDQHIDGLVIPGLVDLQVNGGGGALFNDNPSVDNIKTIATAHAKYGTTSLLPTLITDDIAVMQQAAQAIADAITSNIPGIIGVHFEGPHLSVEKKGAHSANFIRPISEQEWQILSRKDLGRIMVTIAPENVSPDDIKRMVALGVIVCLGHSNASYKTTQAAIDAGASGFTHLFNAMSPIAGREPGVTGCALMADSASCGLIVDGHHVDYVNCQLAIKTKPKGSVFLVTDAMPPVGTNDKTFRLVDRDVFLEDGKLTSTSGELAGSVLDMITAVKNSHQHLHLPLDEAIRMASTYPASFIRKARSIGRIQVGAQADFVVINNKLEVLSTWNAGQVIFQT